MFYGNTEKCALGLIYGTEDAIFEDLSEREREKLQTIHEDNIYEHKLPGEIYKSIH